MTSLSSSSRPLLTGFITLFQVLTVSPVIAEQSLRGSQIFAIERSPNTADDGASLGQQKDLEFSGWSRSRLDYRLKLENGDQIRAAQWLEAELFPVDEELDRFRAETRASYWTQVSKDTQIRLEAAHSYVRDRDQTVFFRPRIGAQARYRHDPQNLSRARLRFGYREQNEATFKGFDQAEVRLELGHDWRNVDRKLRLSGTIFGEHRAADEDRFSYTEGGLRLNGRYALADDLSLSSRIETSFRTYADDFSARVADRREDLRIRAQLGLRYQLNEHVAFAGSVGWDRTNSTIGVRDYSGLTLGLSLEVSGILWNEE
ncbi:MAG: hypothetical protein AAGD13_23530 [Pseudomonadota bacterium]